MKKAAVETEIYARAGALLAAKDFDGALNILDEALEKNMGDDTALALVGDIYAAAGDIPQAMGHYGLAIQAAPDNDQHKRQFINIAGNMVFSQYNPAIEKILCLCLEATDVECAHAQVLWYTLLRSHPQFLLLLKAVFEEPPTPLEKVADLSFLLQPLFLQGVKKIVACNEEFEGFMTALRQFLLEQLEAPQRRLPPEHYGALIEAVALCCFNTDYIFNRTGAEEEAVEALRHELESNPATRQDPFKTGLYACYEPLYKLKAAKDMACLPAVKAQIEDYLDLQARAAKIPSLTEVTDATSLKVREQYEEFPYPRWRELPRLSPAEIVNSRAADRVGLQILIAGCGTGQEPLLLAKSYPQASILAIDLSRSSLAYAAKKAEELGIKNIEFRHADILQLGSLNRTFDHISAMGVLHHMKEPMEGWKVLTGLLKPGGIMRIGLYSAAARRSVVVAWEAIRKGNYPDTAAGMRRFRKDSKKLLGAALYGSIFTLGDNYYLNMYRDLLFHVQEHQFTIPQIKKILDDLNLTFLKMLIENSSHGLPAEQERRSLDDWHRLEEENPDIFVSMYKFWCQKKA